MQILIKLLNKWDVYIYFDLDYNGHQPSKPTRSAAALGVSLGITPARWDWRSRGKVTSAKNQGGCNSCWAFTSTAQYESILAI